MWSAAAVECAFEKGKVLPSVNQGSRDSTASMLIEKVQGSVMAEVIEGWWDIDHRRIMIIRSNPV